MACSCCNDIKLVNPQTGQATVAYENRERKPLCLCLGEPGRLWVYSHFSDQFIELNCKSSILTETEKCTTASRSAQYVFGFGIHYLPYRALVCSGYNKQVIYAQSTETGAVLWKLEGEVAGREINPKGLLLTPDHQAVLCADQWNHRILVLNPADGSVLQIIQLPEELAGPRDLFWSNDQLILIHLWMFLHQSRLNFFTTRLNQ